MYTFIHHPYLYQPDERWSAVAKNIRGWSWGGDWGGFHSTGVIPHHCWVSPLTSFALTPSNKIILNMQFTYHGPDADIRQLRLHSSGATLVNVYDPYSGKVVVSVFPSGKSFSRNPSFYGFPTGIGIIVSRYKPQVRPFSYRPMVEAHLWLQKNDEFILRYWI